MRVSFSPQRRDDTLTLEKSSGDRLRINGELFNFGPLEDGDRLLGESIPAFFASDGASVFVREIERIDGVIHITLILPHSPNPSLAVAFPEPITVTEDGPIKVPFDSAGAIADLREQEELADVDA